MKLNEITAKEQQARWDQFGNELQKHLVSKFGNLSTDDWSVYIEVDGRKWTRKMSGEREEWVRVWLRCYCTIGHDPEPPTEDMHFQVALDLIPKEAARFYEEKTGKVAVIRPMEDYRKDSKIEYWWDIVL